AFKGAPVERAAGDHGHIAAVAPDEVLGQLGQQLPGRGLVGPVRAVEETDVHARSAWSGWPGTVGSRGTTGRCGAGRVRTAWSRKSRTRFSRASRPDCGAAGRPAWCDRRRAGR